MSVVYLVRYGSVPEVSRFVHRSEAVLSRGETVVVRTHRGLQLGSLLERTSQSLAGDEELEAEIVRPATLADEMQARQLTERCEAEFQDWCRRIVLWNLSVELIDLEWTLDAGKQILYVLAERGPATTTLALQAAAEGLGVIEVQPVSAEGLVTMPAAGGGCGTGGCGCSH